MKPRMLLFLVISLIISTGILQAQDNNPPSAQGGTRAAKGQTTVQGCVTRSNSDFTLVKNDPAITYELHSAGKVKLGNYLGQQVEVTGKSSPSLSASGDSLEGRNPSPVTLTVTSIKTIAKECTEKLVSDK